MATGGIVVSDHPHPRWLDVVFALFLVTGVTVGAYCLWAVAEWIHSQGEGALHDMSGCTLVLVAATSRSRARRGMKIPAKWIVCHVLLAAVSGVGGSATAQAKPRFLNPATLPTSRGYTQVVEVPAGERMVYISGQVPLDQNGNVVGAGNFRRQAEQVFVNLDRALAAVGATFADVVKINYYIRDVSHLADLRAVRDQHVNTAAPPASTLVEVSHLFREDVLLEIEAVAAVGSR
jgi:2-iminobutanoate/2-iminopropanoate deaminase